MTNYVVSGRIWYNEALQRNVESLKQLPEIQADLAKLGLKADWSAAPALMISPKNANQQESDVCFEVQNDAETAKIRDPFYIVRVFSRCIA